MAMLSNSPLQLTSLRLEARKSYSLGLWFKLSEGRGVVDLTGATITFTMAQPKHLGGAVVITEDADLVNAAVGYARLSLQALDLDLEEGAYPYSIRWLGPNGYSLVVVKGEAEIVDNTDPATDNVYGPVNPPDSLQVEFRENSITVQIHNQGEQGEQGEQGDPGILLLEPGGVVPADTPVGTVILEKV